MTDRIITELWIARQQAGMTLAQLVEKVGHHSVPGFCDWENGHRSPKLDVLRDWADALGLDLQLVRRA